MKKKLCSIFLVLNIIFANLFGAYINAYATAADIVVGGLMSEGTSMATLMSMFGISPGAAALAAAGGVGFWGIEQVEKYKQYMGAQSEYESEDIANQAAADLLDNLAHGVVNTASQAYSSFKSWLSSLQSGGAFESISTLPYASFPANTPVVVANYSADGKPMPYYQYEYPFYGFYYEFGDSYNIILFSEYLGTITNFGFLGTGFSHGGINYKYRGDSRTAKYYTMTGALPKVDVPRGVASEGYGNVINYVFGLGGVSTPSAYRIPNDLLSGLGQRDKTLENLEQQGISATGAIGTTGTGSRSVDISNALDRTGSSSMDKLLEKVYNGEISWSDFMSALGVATVVDTATGAQAIAIDRTNTAKFEKAEEYEASKDYIPPITDITPSPVYDDADFTIKNLETIFPFCIPFDLYDFINILAAEPQAPHWHLKASFIGRDDLYLDIDLKSWDKVAEYCRDFELLLYIVGLILITRNLIRG